MCHRLAIVPQDWFARPTLQRLCVLAAVRPDRLPAALSLLVADVLGPYASPSAPGLATLWTTSAVRAPPRLPPLAITIRVRDSILTRSCFAGNVQVLADVDSETPVLHLQAPGTDPASEVEAEAKRVRCKAGCVCGCVCAAILTATNMCCVYDSEDKHSSACPSARDSVKWRNEPLRLRVGLERG